MPDFSPPAKQKIIKAVKRELARGDNYALTKRPATPRGATADLGEPQYQYQFPWAAAQNKFAWAIGPVAHPPITDDDL